MPRNYASTSETNIFGRSPRSPNRSLAFVLLTLALLVLIPIALGGMADSSMRQTLDRLDAVRAHSSRAAYLLEDQRSALSAFLITGDHSLKHRFDMDSGSLKREEDGMADALRVVAVEGVAAESWSRPWHEWKDTVAATLIEERSHGDVAVIQRELPAAEMMIQATLGRLANLDERLSKRRQETLDRYGQTRRILGAMTATLALLSALAGLVVYRAQKFISQNLEALSAERVKLASVFDSVDLGIALWDARLRRLTLNPAAVRILGADTPDQLTVHGSDYLSALNPRVPDGLPLDSAKLPMAEALGGESFDGQEIALHRPDGSDLEIVVVGGPVMTDRRGRVTLAVNVFRDVTASREADRRIRQLYFANSRRLRELESIFTVSEDLSLTGGVDRMSSRLTEEVARLFQSEKCAIWLKNSDGDFRLLLPAYGFAEEKADLEPGAWAMRILEEDGNAFLDSSDLQGEAAGLKNGMAVRLSVSGSPLGILAVYNRKSGEFEETDARLLHTFAGQAAFAIHSAQLFEELRRRADLLEWAMQETHHRIKNNLQAVSAILDMRALDARSNAVPVEVIREVLRQIRAIAVVHDLLSQSKTGIEEGLVDTREALERLVPILTMGRAGGDVHTDMRVASVPVPAKIATALGLVVNELVGNAMKHGRHNGNPVEICVELDKTDDRLRLAVSDNGPGFAPGFQARSASGLGLDLVRTLIERDLSGTIRFATADGAKVLVEVPLPHQNGRSSRRDEHTGIESAHL